MAAPVPRIANAVLGLGIAGFMGSVYWYSMRAVADVRQHMACGMRHRHSHAVCGPQDSTIQDLSDEAEEQRKEVERGNKAATNLARQQQQAPPIGGVQQ